MKISIIVLSLIITSLLLSCSKSDENPYEDSVCDHITKVDNSRYKSNESKGFSIRSVQIMGDCLEIEIASGGCNGDTWKVELIDADRVAESNPVQRDLKILLDSKELCNAMVIKTYTFDLRPIRTGSNVVLLNLVMWDGQLRYEY